MITLQRKGFTDASCWLGHCLRTAQVQPITAQHWRSCCSREEKHSNLLPQNDFSSNVVYILYWGTQVWSDQCYAMSMEPKDDDGWLRFQQIYIKLWHFLHCSYTVDLSGSHSAASVNWECVHMYITPAQNIDVGGNVQAPNDWHHGQDQAKDNLMLCFYWDGSLPHVHKHPPTRNRPASRFRQQSLLR